MVLYQHHNNVTSIFELYVEQMVTLNINTSIQSLWTASDINGLKTNTELQYSHLIPAPVDRASAGAWLYKYLWITCQGIS